MPAPAFCPGTLIRAYPTHGSGCARIHSTTREDLFQFAMFSWWKPGAGCRRGFASSFIRYVRSSEGSIRRSDLLKSLKAKVKGQYSKYISSPKTSGLISILILTVGFGVSKVKIPVHAAGIIESWYLCRGMTVCGSEPTTERRDRSVRRWAPRRLRRKTSF